MSFIIIMFVDNVRLCNGVESSATNWLWLQLKGSSTYKVSNYDFLENANEREKVIISYC